jgi:hypothetical protein
LLHAGAFLTTAREAEALPGTGETEPHPARPEVLIRWSEREAARSDETA